MSENIEAVASEDVEMNNSALSFDNLVILKEFGNIVDNVRNEDLLETVPKAKLRRVKWVPIFKFLKQQVLDEMIQSMTLLWQDENMPEKIAALEKQKEKFAHINSDETLWRPQLGDVKAQLRACDIAKMQEQKVLLETLAKEYEARVAKQKKTMSAKRGYLKALQMDIQKYLKKNEEFMEHIKDKLEKHSNSMEILLPGKVNLEDMDWSSKELDLSD